jgi:hypothetical protein
VKAFDTSKNSTMLIWPCDIITARHDAELCDPVVA